MEYPALISLLHFLPLTDIGTNLTPTHHQQGWDIQDPLLATPNNGGLSQSKNKPLWIPLRSILSPRKVYLELCWAYEPIKGSIHFHTPKKILLFANHKH